MSKFFYTKSSASSKQAKPEEITLEQVHIDFMCERKTQAMQSNCKRSHQLEEAYDNKKTKFSETRDLAHTLISCLGRKPLLLTLAALLSRNVGAAVASSEAYESDSTTMPDLMAHDSTSAPLPTIREDPSGEIGEPLPKLERYLSSSISETKPTHMFYKSEKHFGENKTSIPYYDLGDGEAKKLGQGAYGVVFEAYFEDIKGDRQKAALKVCRIKDDKEKKAVELMLKKEADVHIALADTKHCIGLYACWRQNLNEFRTNSCSQIVQDSIPEDIENGEQECQIFLLPLCNKGSLRSFIDQKAKALAAKKKMPKSRMSPLNEIDYWTYAKQVVQGYQEMHARNVLYRDGNMTNFFVHQNKEEEPQIKLADFGLSLPNFPDGYDRDELPNFEGYGNIPDWSAPEWYTRNKDGKIHYTFNSDIYSIGWFLKMMSKELQKPLRYVDHTDKCEIPTKLTKVIDALSTECLDTDPEQRPSLEQILSEISDAEASARSASPPKRKKRKGKRSKPAERLTNERVEIITGKWRGQMGKVDRFLVKKDKWGITLDNKKRCALKREAFKIVGSTGRRLASKLERFEQMF